VGSRLSRINKRWAKNPASARPVRLCLSTPGELVASVAERFVCCPLGSRSPNRKKPAMPSRSKRHHYVTRAYLEGFLDPNQYQLWCWLRKKDKPFRALPEKIACEKDYYSFRNPNNTWNDTAERFFADQIENPGLPVLKRLAAGKTMLTWPQRRAFSLLLALQELGTFLSYTGG
jgi:hypothetical protein